MDSPFSIVIPAYNEEGGITPTIAAIKEKVLSKAPAGCELIIVDDKGRYQYS